VGFIVPFMVLLVAVALLAALVVGRGLARDLRRVEQALRGLADAGRPVGEAERPADADPGDELALLAWTAGRLGERCAADLERYRDARSAETRVRRSKLDFLAVMSHELRTPLNTILGFAELLLEGLEGDVTPGQREDLRIVRHSGEHLLSLVNDILDLSALRSGQMTPLLETVDLAGLGHQVLDEAEAQVHGRPVHLATEFGEEPLVVQADRRMIWRVLHNLVGNALKFTNRGEVRLRLRRDGDVAVIEVCDTGAGMSPESLAMIFEEYRQAGDARAKREGAGLGLAIARRLLELHGGTVTAESEPGRGSTFTVRLPVSGPAAAVAATSGTPPTAPRAAGEAGDG
jgi:signal transduction histidine kinase